MAVSLVVLGCLFIFMLWTAMPHFAGDLDAEFAKRTPVRVYENRRGKRLLLEPTYDGEYRLDVSLEKISPHVVSIMLAVEDRHFYEHDGVDRIAALRSLWMNIRHAGIMSGASTVTMQLAGMTLVKRKRSLAWKFQQAGAARKLEWLHGKKWILENYLNRIPFGGKIHGIEAAGWYYFGRQAATLNHAEATLLCGLPQRPNAFRPDRYPERARDRQKMVLLLLERNGDVTHEEAGRIFMEEPLRYRDFTLSSPLRSLHYHRNDHYLRMAKTESKGALNVRCALDERKQTLLLESIRSQVSELQGVDDGAGVIIDNATAEVLAMVGTLDYASPHAGQVNVAISRRTAGSALKPFIFAEAVDGGLLCADTLVYDTPLRYGTYAPGNYDGTYQNGITAADALSLSLNTPAVRLVAKLGPMRVLEVFRRLGMMKYNYWKSNRELACELGLTLALGTGGYRLLDITAAYSALASGGTFRPPTFLVDGASSSGTRVFTQGASAVVLSMISKRRLPGCEMPIAWKTGTSTGNHDAWCFASTCEYTVGIWLGNKNGKPSDTLVGATAAAPVVVAVMNALYRDTHPQPFDLDSWLSPVALCAATGLRAVPGICDVKQGRTAKGIPLKQCQKCGKRTATRVNILKPKPQTYIVRRGGHVRLPVETSPEEVHWYVNDGYRGMMKSGECLTLGPGHYFLRAVSEEEGIRPGTVIVDVKSRDDAMKK
ncbi:MAG: transglycosylase domain-containing protein [Victivallales bacterium]|nr:transglycosylase domain-containing protein [Victivallales bacterium]